MKVSIIVPVFNGERALPKLLALLSAQTYSATQTEILCVDNNSTDHTAEIIQTWGDARVRYLNCERQSSYAARNLGITNARGEILAFTDVDCEPTPEWLAGGVDQIVTTKVDRVAGALFIPVTPRSNIWELVDASFYLDQERAAEQGWAATANLIMRRDVIARVGLFNERLISWGDIEFGLRCTTAYVSIAFGPQARVLHAPRSRALQIIRRSRRSGLGQAQIVHEGLPAYSHSWQKILPRPLSQKLYDERLKPLHLSRWRLGQIQILRYLSVEVVHMLSYTWGRLIVRNRLADEIVAKTSRSESQPKAGGQEKS